MDQGDFAFVKAHGANMRGVSCVGTIFAFATLTGGPQEWFTLAQSDCSGANFYRAELTYADFSWSDLSVANMQVDRHVDIACRSTPASLTHSLVTIYADPRPSLLTLTRRAHRRASTTWSTLVTQS